MEDIMILKDFLFLDDTSGAESNPLIVGSTGAGALNLNVEGAGSVNLSVKGEIDGNATSPWVTISSVCTSNNFSVQSSITADGIYIIPVSGFKAVKIVNNGVAGTVRVYGSLEA